MTKFIVESWIDGNIGTYSVYADTMTVAEDTVNFYKGLTELVAVFNLENLHYVGKENTITED